jgi:Domain of unknown function (DUF5698)
VIADLVQPVVIGALVIIEVGVFHLRVALAARGRRSAAMMLGAVNAVISVAALGQVLTNLDRPANVIGYAVGVSIGVYLGCVADDRLRTRPHGPDRRRRRRSRPLTDVRGTRLAGPVVDQGVPVDLSKPGGDAELAEEEHRRSPRSGGSPGVSVQPELQRAR